MTGIYERSLRLKHSEKKQSQRFGTKITFELF